MKERIALAVLFASLAWTTVPRLIDVAAESVQLLPLSYEQRRSRMIGSFYDVIKRLRSELPPEQRVALMLKSAEDINVAVFFNYYMYPRHSRIYANLGSYRNDPSPPQILLNLDRTRSPEVQWMPYAEIRADRIGSDFVTPRLEALYPTSTSFSIPAVASLDGPDPDLYVTEGFVENTSGSANRVRLELLPRARSFEIVLAPGERRVWSDVVYQVFGAMDQGWLRITADERVRAGFWFVNRGRNFSAPLPLIKLVRQARFEGPKDSRFYVINPADTGLMVRIGSEDFYVGPREFINGYRSGEMRFSSDQPFYAFVSWRDRLGATVFRWP